jgi:hypothetical protein
MINVQSGYIVSVPRSMSSVTSFCLYQFAVNRSYTCVFSNVSHRDIPFSGSQACLIVCLAVVSC